jgi:ribonuclease HI
VGRWLTESRTLKYEALLPEKDDVTLTTDEALNPATFFVGKQEGGAPEHKCLDIIEYQMKVRPNLRETPFQTGLHFFEDGSSQVIEGKRHDGYSNVDGEATTTIESVCLPNNWSAQTCELFALNQVLKHLKDKEGTIYTDSKYAFGVVHTFAKIWMKRGLINSKAQDLVHGELIQQIVESL